MPNWARSSSASDKIASSVPIAVVTSAEPVDSSERTTPVAARIAPTA